MQMIDPINPITHHDNHCYNHPIVYNTRTQAQQQSQVVVGNVMTALQRSHPGAWVPVESSLGACGSIALVYHIMKDKSVSLS